MGQWAAGPAAAAGSSRVAWCGVCVCVCEFLNGWLVGLWSVLSKPGCSRPQGFVGPCAVAWMQQKTLERKVLRQITKPLHSRAEHGTNSSKLY